MTTQNFICGSRDAEEGIICGMQDTEGPGRAVRPRESMTKLSAIFQHLKTTEGIEGNDDADTVGFVAAERGRHDISYMDDDQDDAVNDDGTLNADNLNEAHIGSINHDLDGIDDTNSTSESDIDEFLEYAREVIANNNLSYDSTSFRDFESLLQECVVNHFLDDDEDDDSLVSSSSFSGYFNEGGIQPKSALLNNPAISDTAFHRLKGIIARKKTGTVPQYIAAAPTRDKRNDSLAVAQPGKCTLEDSDESAMSIVSVHSLTKARAQGVQPTRSTRNDFHHPRENSSLLSDSSSTLESPPKRPRRKKRRPTESKKPKPTMKFNPLPGKAQKRNTPRPPSSPMRANQLKGAFNDSKLNLGNGKSAGGEKRISNIIGSPKSREMVLRFLKERAPSLHDSVLARLQLESHVQDIPVKISVEVESAQFRTPEKCPRGGGQLQYDDPQKNMCREAYSYINIDTARGMLPSMVRETQTTAIGSSSQIFRGSNMDDTVDIFLTSGIDRVLRDMQERRKVLTEKESVLREIEIRSMTQQESITQRGMALIHKFRAKRKAALQARYMQHSGQYTAEGVHLDSFCPEETERHVGPELSPEQLESYLSGHHSSSPISMSSIGETKERLRRVKEKRKKASCKRQESEKSLLRHESIDESFDKRPDPSNEKSVAVTRPSPFKTIAFPRNTSERNYEILSESIFHSYNVGDIIEMQQVDATPPSRKQSSSLFNGELSPKSPPSLSRIRDKDIGDSSEDSNHIPTIFEDNKSHDDEHFLKTSSCDSGDWSQMTFHSDTDRFAESSSSCFSKSRGPGFSTSAQTSRSAEALRLVVDDATPSKRYNDSFDEIVFRQTSSLKAPVIPGDERSPSGVADLFSSNQNFVSRRKANNLAFVDEEESDPLFTDKEDSFDMALTEALPIHKPVFLSPRLFEI